MYNANKTRKKLGWALFFFKLDQDLWRNLYKNTGKLTKIETNQQIESGIAEYKLCILKHSYKYM